jgi:DivIVA domain-containing protein
MWHQQPEVRVWAGREKVRMGRDGLYLLGRMVSEITPGEIRRAEFRTTLRGFDRDEVMSYLTSIAQRLERLEADNEKLASQSTEIADRDLEDEFEKIGREVSSILQSAREAADAMRERASLDASRWRSEAMEEAETNRREAAADAEALRRDAWTTGTELLTQTAAEAKRMREQAERDVLTIQGEAEREAHRLTSGARREAEDLVRNARMDAEKITSDAAKRRDDIIDQANRQAAAAQERTRALEQRRDELMEELENVRSTLSRLEGSLEERRETLELSKEESTSVRVIPPTPQAEEPEHWEPGETVRVVRADDEDPEHIVDIDLPDQDIEPRPEIKPIGVTQPAVEVIESKATRRTTAEEREPPPDIEDVVEKPEEPEHVATEPPPQANDVDALFEALREGGHVSESSSATETGKSRGEQEVEDQGQVPDDATEADTGRDWIEVRDSRLLPITNRALRGTKKALTELQNIALDGLRTEEEWRPDVATINEALQAELKAVWAESFSAGHVVAEEMTGSKIQRPPTPPADTLPRFAEALASSVGSALEDAEDGQRARQAAASRVFRVWRTDEAERRIRELAIHSYELGVERSVEVDAPVG